MFHSSGKIFISISLLLLLTSIFGWTVVQFLFHLLLGWAAFLRNTLPHVRLDLSMLASGIVALTFAVWGLHRFASWLTAQLPNVARVWRTRWTLALTVLVLLLFTSAIAGIGIAHQAAWLSRAEWTTAGHEEHFENLLKGQRLRHMLAMRASEAGGRYPEQLASLFDDEDPALLELLLPVDEKGAPESWIYLAAGLPSDSPPWVPVLVSPHRLDLHSKRTVFRHGGITEHLPESAYQELLQQWRAYRRASIPAAVAR